ncbi:MAG: cation transporter [Methylotenera sp.]|nr:cation transporter [Oligoflexia bacterium]
MSRAGSRSILNAHASTRSKAATLALVATVGLTVLKLGVGFLSGSVGVISEGIHSFLDLVSATVAFFTVREAGKPADPEHPFGHGKIETLSSLFESLLLVVAAGFITYEGIEHFSHPAPIAHQNLAVITILISMVVSYFVYVHNAKAAQETDSSAIKVNALHFLSDVVASAGILVGLLILRFTGWLLIDPLMAFGVAGYILLISIKQVKEALFELADTQLPEREVTELRKILDRFQGGEAIESHDLRTRKSGATRHIDFHLVVCGEMSVTESHAICDEMEAKIIEDFPSASVNIHVEPCETENMNCQEGCARFQAQLGRKRKV